MSVLKQYNEATSAWEPVVIGKQGNSGVMSVQSPLTNSGTANAAVLGLDANAFSYGQNAVINGGFDVSQRGTAITSINTDYTYTADRWYVTRGGSVDYAQRELGTYAPPAGFHFYGEYVNKSAANPFMEIAQPIETKNALAFAGKTVTISFYARAHADTVASKSFKTQLLYSASADTKAGTGLGYVTIPLAYGTTASNWTRYTYTASVPSTAKTLTLSIIKDSALAINDGIHITGVQLEAGSVATPFKRNAPNIQAELAACQRYYQRYTVGSAFGFLPAGGYAVSTTAIYSDTRFIVPMRVAPTAVEFGGAIRVVSSVDGGYSMTAYSLGGAGIYGNGGQITVASGLTTGGWYKMQANNDANAYIAFPAEL